MSHKLLVLLLLATSGGFGQSTTTSSALRKGVIHDTETAAPAPQPPEAKPPAGQKPGEDPTPDSPLGNIAGAGLDQRVAPATALANSELLVRGKTIYVVSESFFVKKEQLERGLIDRKELGEWGIHVVGSEKQADLILTVRRAPFQNNFPFTFKDRVSGIVVMGGTVNSLFGTVPGKIAGRLADHLKEIYAEEQKLQKK